MRTTSLLRTFSSLPAEIATEFLFVGMLNVARRPSFELNALSRNTGALSTNFTHYGDSPALSP